MIDSHYATSAQDIILGSGSITRIADLTRPFGWQRILLCSSPSLSHEGHVTTIQNILGERLVARYDQIQAHVQDFQLSEALSLAKAHQIDAVIGLGGGSSIGMAKAVSHRLEEKHFSQVASAALLTGQPMIPVIAIPTTYAGSEMTPIYGVTHSGDVPRKITVSEPKITPKLVIYDPDLTLDLPSSVTASSGINALAHCVEALYSPASNPLASAAAKSAIEHIAAALLRCTARSRDLEARTEMLTGAHLAGFALSLTTMGLHHGLCHVLGGSANMPHGIANSVMLPHAMRFNLDAAVPELAMVAVAMGLTVNGSGPEAAEAAIEGIYDLIGQLGLPQHLRDVGVSESDLPRLAKLALQSRAVQGNLKPITDASQTEAVLRAAW